MHCSHMKYIERLQQDNGPAYATIKVTLAAIRSLEKLVGLIPSDPSQTKKKSQVQLLIYLDEAQALVSMKTHPGEENLHDCLLSAFASYSDAKGCKAFLLTLSTLSQVSSLAKPAFMFNSARANSKALLPPYTEMPYDCHPDLERGLVISGQMLDEITSFSHDIRYGRPL